MHTINRVIMYTHSFWTSSKEKHEIKKNDLTLTMNWPSNGFKGSYKKIKNNFYLFIKIDKFCIRIRI